MRYINKTSIIIALCLMTFAITAICIRVDSSNKTSDEYILGGIMTPKPAVEEISAPDGLSRQTISLLNKQQASFNEIFFRPSKLKALNNNFSTLDDLNQTFIDGVVPPSVINTPQDAIINYFSVLQQASNITDSKSRGCGTIGYSNIPYPIAYNFFTETNKKTMSYEEYFNSFEGIEHINLIKIVPIVTEEKDTYKYFVELEILEGTSIGSTTFNYYWGIITLIDVDKSFYIDSFTLTPEDFVCAPYHGWAHDAETYVEVVYGNWCGMIMKQYAPKQNDFAKEIIVDGVDKEKYMFRFARLTNGTDLFINSLIKKDGKWEPIQIDVDGCLKKNQQ